MIALTKRQSRIRRHRRVRSKIEGTKSVPRLCIFRSNKHLTVQVIDDSTGKVLAFSSDAVLTDKKLRGVDAAKEIGKTIAGKITELKVKKVVFDRGGYTYHGNVKAIAEAVREAGITI